MKITNIRATPVNIPLEAPFCWTGGLYPGTSKAIVEVETDEGLVGLGEAPSTNVCAMIVAMGEALAGKDALDIAACERICVPPWQIVQNTDDARVVKGFGAIEIALWDLRGKAWGQPLSTLIGGKARDAVAFSEYFASREGREMTPEAVVEYCLKMRDGQAMQESTISMLAAVQCRAHFILHAAGWLEGGLTMGYEKLIMDADFCAALHVWMGGLKLDDNQIALDAFREVGPGKHFFGCAHTLANYETAFWESAVADNNSFERWRDEGMKDAPARAAARAKRLLAEYEPPKLDPGIDEELADFVQRRKAERPDQWH